MTAISTTSSPRFLIFGPKGWIGSTLLEMLTKQGKVVKGASCRLEEREKVLQELDDFKPTHVLNCAGQTGRPVSYV
jgi:3,5-epimerase/4-reductase